MKFFLVIAICVGQVHFITSFFTKGGKKPSYGDNPFMSGQI